MTPAVRKYNPGFLSDADLVATFCVRTREFASIVEALRESSGRSNTHQIVIGPRGSGKTCLLLRVAAEINRDVELASRFFPVVFAEESYEISSAGEFWLECLSRVADQAPHRDDDPDLRRTHEELRLVPDDRTLEGRCLGALQDFADREGKRLVLFVENLNMLFRDIAGQDTGWRLRKVLQTEERIVLLASATSRFDEIDDPDKALYDLFRVVQLSPLDTGECEILWRQVSGQGRAPQTIRGLRILTGGSPRLLTIVARFGAGLSFHGLLDDLLDLVDDHTEYFKSHLDALAPQERRVYLALARLWKPATAREAAEQARLDTSKCSAQLARLVERGAVEVTGGSARRKLYYLTERLYNIYFLMRQARGPAPLIEALILFMEGCYATDRLKEFGARIAREAREIDRAAALSTRRTAFERLIRLPSLAAHREELLKLAPAGFGSADRRGDRSTGDTGSTPARALFLKGVESARNGRQEEALAIWKELVDRFGRDEAPGNREQVSLALANTGVTLSHLDRTEEALATWDSVIDRFGGDGQQEDQAVMTALLGKGSTFETNRPLDALAVCDEILRRFRKTRNRSLQTRLASALQVKGAALLALNRPKEALAALDELLERFEACETPSLAPEIASAMANRGVVLLELGQPAATVTAVDQVVQRFGESSATEVLEYVAFALAIKATALVFLRRPQDALTACDELRLRHTKGGGLFSNDTLANERLARGNALNLLDRREEAFAAWHECEQSFGDLPAEQKPVASALFNKGLAQLEAGRPEEALATWGDIDRRFGKSEQRFVLVLVAEASTAKGTVLAQLNRKDEALTVWEEVESRFGSRKGPEFRELVAECLVNRGNVLAELGRPREALTAFDRTVRYVGTNETAKMIQAVARALHGKGAALAKLNRARDAVAAWNEVIMRFGHGSCPEVLKVVANALVHKGAALVELGRLEEAVATWDDTLERFGVDDGSPYPEETASALNNKASALEVMDRPEEALAVYHDVVKRFRSSVNPTVVDAVARSSVGIGNVLARLNRTAEAVAAWQDVVRRFGHDGTPSQRQAAVNAQLSLAEHELKHGTPYAAVKAATCALQRDPDSPENQWRALFIRARANLGNGDTGACIRDIDAGLTILPRVGFLPREVLNSLLEMAVKVGAGKMRDVIRKSPSAGLLLPFTTALDRELGLVPRVAKEVWEVSEDILRNLKEERDK